MILLVKFSADAGRMGTLEGASLIQKSEWEKLQGRRWYASDVLGKHSEFSGTIDEEDEDWTIRELTDEQVTLLQDIFEFDLKRLNSGFEVVLSGFCPISHLSEDYDEEGEFDEETEEPAE